MRRILATAVAAAALLRGASAAAQWVVTDPLAEANTLETAIQGTITAAQGVKTVANQAIQITQLAATVNAVVHGDLYAVAGLVPELASAGLIDPLGLDAAGIADAISGVKDATAAGQKFLSQVQAFKSTMNDYRAQALDLQARALAGQLGTSQKLIDASRQRMTLLPAIVNRPTVDLKDAADKTARLTGELAVQSAQANQMGALTIMASTYREASAARDAQMWRCSAERLVQEAWAAAGGVVSGSAPSCAIPDLPDAPGGDTGGMVSDAGGAGTGVIPAAASIGNGNGNDGGTLAKLAAQSWGAQAASNAVALGVTPVALASTGVLESNLAADPGGTGTVSGAFQMTDGTYAQTVREVQASNPALASQITTKNDPASQSIAASQYLKDSANALQNAGISNPTVLDTRSYYQFGPRYGVDVATASSNQLMSDVLAGTSAATLRANGITPTTTVGQWRATVTNRIGQAANQPVLIGGTTA